MADLFQLKRVLVLEDETLIAMDLADSLADAGVGSIAGASTVEQALALLDEEGLDAAVIDLHLGRGIKSHPVARRLSEKGVPFIFTSGNVEPVREFPGVPLVPKPYRTEAIIAALLRVIGGPVAAVAG
jgi:DNA-binding response OmpR family regulator